MQEPDASPASVSALAQLVTGAREARRPALLDVQIRRPEVDTAALHQLAAAARPVDATPHTPWTLNSAMLICSTVTLCPFFLRRLPRVLPTGLCLRPPLRWVAGLRGCHACGAMDSHGKPVDAETMLCEKTFCVRNRSGLHASYCTAWPSLTASLLLPLPAAPVLPNPGLGISFLDQAGRGFAAQQLLEEFQARKELSKKVGGKTFRPPSPALCTCFC